MKTNIYFALVLMTSATSIANAQLIIPGENVFIGSVNGWTMRSYGNSFCSIESLYGDGLRVAVVFTRDAPDRALIYLSNPSWQAIRAGQSYPVNVRYRGRDTPFSATAENSSIAGAPVHLVFNVRRVTLQAGLSDGHGYTISVNGQPQVLFRGELEVSRRLSGCANSLRPDPFSAP